MRRFYGSAGGFRHRGAGSFGGIGEDSGDGMRLAGWITVVALAAGLLYAGCYQARRAVEVPYSFAVEARFTDLPADDRPFADWLEAQPGVMRGVGIGRLGDGRVLVLFRLSRNLLGEPPIPRIDEAAADLGYTGGPFRDAPRNTPAVLFYE